MNVARLQRGGVATPGHVASSMHGRRIWRLASGFKSGRWPTAAVDTRFVRTWRRADDRRRHGERFDRVLSSMSSAELVEALAGAGKEDPVAANAIATTILNRLRRGRLFGAFLGVGLVLLVGGLVLVAVDLAMTGTFGLLETSPMGLDVAAVGAASLGASGRRHGRRAPPLVAQARAR